MMARAARTACKATRRAVQPTPTPRVSTSAPTGRIPAPQRRGLATVETGRRRDYLIR